MTLDPIHVLLVEDDSAYARLVSRMFSSAGAHYRISHVRTLSAAIAHAAEHACDVVLLDLGLPDSGGLDTLLTFTERTPSPAVVVLTSSDDERLASGALQAGAQDYVRKDQAEPDVLLRALRYAVERQRAARALRHKDETLQALFNASPLAIAVIDRARLIQMWNPAAERLFGWAAENVIGHPIPYAMPETTSGIDARMEAVMAGRSVTGEETQARCKDGQIIDISVSASPLLADDGSIVGVTAVYKDITEDKHTEHALRESERRYRLLFESNPQPMWVYDSETLRFLAVNEAAVRGYGYSRAEFLGRTLRDVLEDPALHDPLADAGAQAAASSRTLTRLRRKDGTRLTAQVTAHALTFDGRPARLAMAQDVTEQVRADERLRFLNEASALLNSADLEGTLQAIATLASQSFAEGAGILLVDDTGQLTQFFIDHRDDGTRARLVQSAESARRERISLPLVLREVLESGQPYLSSEILPSDWAQPEAHDPAAWQPRAGSTLIVPIVMGQRPFGVLVLVSGAADRQYDRYDVGTAEGLGRRLALTIENARLVREARELFEADLTGNFVATPEGEILARNPAFSEMLKYPLGATLPTRISDLFDDPSAWAGLVARVRAHGRITPTELTLLSADQKLVHVLLSAAGVFDERGVMSRVRGQVYDISAHKRVEVQLSQSQKMEAVGRLAGGIAHDFNNLLTIIGGQAERLQFGLPSGSELRRSADAVAQAAERAAGLTQQLLAFSRRQVLAPRVLSLNALVKAVHGMVERMIGEDIQCVVSLSPDIGAVKADAGGLEQALLNLAVNARDAMPKGGTFTIATADVQLEEAAGGDYFAVMPGRYVRLSVSDNGTGMDAETRARAFEPFFTTKEVGKGTGLGLSMVYGVVKQSGGYIWVDSEPGLGTTFRIYLPVVDEAVQAPPPVKQITPTGGTETILLVEDEDGVRDLIEEILQMQGYRVLAASGGTEALRISEATPDEIHLLVTDVVMPHMSGRELALRLLKTRPGVRVMFLSGYTDDAIRHHGVLEPGTAFLQKPFATAELTKKVREVLDSPAV